MFQKTTAAWATNSLIINLGIGRRPQNNLMCHEILLQANMTCVGVPAAVPVDPSYHPLRRPRVFGPSFLSIISAAQSVTFVFMNESLLSGRHGYDYSAHRRT